MTLRNMIQVCNVGGTQYTGHQKTVKAVRQTGPIKKMK